MWRLEPPDFLHGHTVASVLNDNSVDVLLDWNKISFQTNTERDIMCLIVRSGELLHYSRKQTPRPLDHVRNNISGTRLE